MSDITPREPEDVHAHHDQSDPFERAAPEELSRQRDLLRDEVHELREQLRHSPTRARELENRVLQLQTSLATLSTQNERLVRTLKEAREQIVTLKSEVDRLAQPPSAYGLILESYDDATVDILTGGRKMRVAVSPTVDPATLSAGREVMLNEALNVVATCGYERVGEVVMVKEILDDDRILVVAHADEERVCRRADSLEGQLVRVGDALMLDPRSGLRLRADPQGRGPGPRPRGGPRHRLRGHRWPVRPDRADPRRGRAALPAPRAVQGAPAAAAEGRPALRPARLRQDAHRQGGGGVAGQEGGRAHRGRAGEELLPQHQGPGAAQQVRRRDRAPHPADLPARPREGVRRHAGRRVLRRDGLAVPHPRVRRLQRRRDDDRAAAAVRDRRRGAAGERHRHRGVQPRGHDRPGDPAARPPRREDQDRAARRRERPRHLQQVPRRGPAAARARPVRERRQPRWRPSRA